MADAPCCPVGGRHDAAELNAALLQVGQDGAESLSAIARRTGLAKSSLSRHRNDCLGGAGGVPSEGQEEPPSSRPERPVPRAPERSKTVRNAAGTGSGTGIVGLHVPNPGDDPKTAPRKIAQVELEASAMALRKKGWSNADIARKLQVAPATVADALERVQIRLALRAEKDATDLADDARALRGRAMDLLEQVLAGSDNGKGVLVVDYKAAGLMLREARGNLELEAKILGQIQPPSTTINLFGSPDWQKLRDVILDTLIPFPDALAAVVAAIERVQNGGDDGGGGVVIETQAA